MPLPGLVPGKRPRVYRTDTGKAPPAGSDRAPTDLAARVSAALDAVLESAPVPVVADGTGVTALLAMVDPAVVARARTTLEARFAPFEVTREALPLEGLRALGPLAGRLDRPGGPDPA